MHQHYEFGIEKSCNHDINDRYRIYVRVDSDDILDKTFLEKTKAAIHASNKADIIFGDYQITDTRNNQRFLSTKYSRCSRKFSIGDFMQLRQL